MSEPQSLSNHEQGFILTRNQKDVGGQTVIEVWLTTNCGPVKLITPPQESTFFIPKEQVNRAKRYLDKSNIRYHLRDVELKTFEQEPVIALYFHKPSAAYQARDMLLTAGIECYEYDIRLTERFLMERFSYGSVTYAGNQHQENGYQSITQARVKAGTYQPDFRVLSLDIECGPGGELYSIGLAAKDYQCVLMIGQPKNATEQENPNWIKWFTNERTLLLGLIKEVSTYNPDIFIGWSVVQFDFRLLIKRAEKHRIPLTLNRDGSAISWREGRADSNQGFVNMTGRIIVDGIDALKTATYLFDSFSLEFVAQTLLGKGKATEDVDNRVEHINHDFRHNKVKLAHYNLQDCVLVNEIFEHTKLLDFLTLRSQLTGLELDRAGGSVAAFVNLYLPKLHRAGYIAPNRPVGGGLASPGGYVMDSQPGIYKNVMVLDFKSLYPSIIRTFKIDPLGLVEGLQASDEEAIPGFRGGQFSRNKHFLPDIITSLWKQRDEAKKNKDAARSQAIKILMNSFYGVLGSGGCPFYDTRLASSITMRGHDIMQTTAKWIKDKGHQVIYGDTDSTFVWLEGDLTKEQAYAIGNEMAEGINAFWQQKLSDEFNLECHLEIEFETHFEKFLMPTIRGSEMGSKKRYAGIRSNPGDQPGQLLFKGLETVRSDWTPLAKEFQQKLYEMVFAEEDVTQYLRQVIDDTRAGVHDHQLHYRKRLRQSLDKYVKNVPPHVKAARFADEKNKGLGKPLQYQRKGWITYIMTLNGPEAVEYQESTTNIISKNKFGPLQKAFYLSLVSILIR